jgi:hypothetical protein
MAAPRVVVQGQIAHLRLIQPRTDRQAEPEPIYHGAKATFLMVLRPIDSLWRQFSWFKATFPMVGGQKSDVFHSTMATSLMDSGTNEGDSSHGSRLAGFQ